MAEIWAGRLSRETTVEDILTYARSWRAAQRAAQSPTSAVSFLAERIYAISNLIFALQQTETESGRSTPNSVCPDNDETTPVANSTYATSNSHPQSQLTRYVSPRGLPTALSAKSGATAERPRIQIPASLETSSQPPSPRFEHDSRSDSRSISATHTPTESSLTSVPPDEPGSPAG